MSKSTGTPKSARFTDKELPDLEAAIERAGGFKAVVMAGIRATNAAKTNWPAELRRLANELEKRK